MAVNGFGDLKAACTMETDLTEFRKCVGRYRIKASTSDVWSSYVHADPMTSWKTRKSATGLVYYRHNDSLVYPGQHIDQTMQGQVLFLNLKLAKGLFKMATAFEIMEVSDADGIITFSYLNTGKTHGLQEVKFLALDNQNTLIEHTSWVRSGSKFRDSVLYPFFHKKLIRAFHRKMKDSIV